MAVFQMSTEGEESSRQANVSVLVDDRNSLSIEQAERLPFARHAIVFGPQLIFDGGTQSGEMITAAESVR